LKQARIIVRMGATEWTVTVSPKNRPVTVDLRSMSKTERRAFHGQFMAAYRADYYAPHNHRKAS
jgi:hypothetical protein